MTETRWSRIRQRVPCVLSVVRLLLLPAVGILILQCLSSYMQNFDESVFYVSGWFTGIGTRFVWNYLILLIPYLILYALPHFKFTSFALNIVIFVFGLAEHFVILFRNTIIYPWDFDNIGLAASVGSTYEYTISKEVVYAALMFVGMCILSLIGKDPKFKPWLRAVMAAAVILFGSLYMGGFVMSKTAQMNSGIRFYYTLVNYNYENGVLMNFCYHFRFVFHEKPEGYSEETVREDLSAYTGETDTLTPGGSRPDVIMVMSEAFSDLRVYGDTETSQKVLPFWDSLSGNSVIKKTLITSAFGGNTANTEFGVLTGMTTQFFPSGTYPFKHYIRNEVTSIASLLKDNGYDTLAVHPFDLTGWNRINVMPLLGFEDFIGEDAFPDAVRYRSYVSDQSAYEYIIGQYEKHIQEKPDTPLFEYLISIQNHGGYSSFASLPYSVSTDGQMKYPQANQYYSLLRLSDDALKMLVTYFQKVDRPTVIIVYGDHQPNLTDGYSDYLKTLTAQNDPMYLLNRYATQIMVWANYDISESDLAEISQSYLSANYVSTYLADILGLQRTSFQQFLLDMHEEIPAIDESYIVGNDGTVYKSDAKDLPADIAGWIEKYRKYQYYELYDSYKNR